MKESRQLTSGFERTFDKLMGLTDSPVNQDIFVYDDQEKESPPNKDEKIPRDKDTKTQRQIEIM